jgi:hypothetical protein
MSVVQARRPLASIAAVAAGVVAVGGLSFLTDQAFHSLHVYPPPGEPMFEPGLNLLVLSYRFVFAVAGGYLVARLAPQAAMTHVRVLGVLGTCLAAAGAAASIPMDIAPVWTPLALVATAYPLTWFGGLLALRPKAETK